MSSVGPGGCFPASVRGHILSTNHRDQEGRDERLCCRLEVCDMESLWPDHCIGRQPADKGLSKLCHAIGIFTLFSNVISKLN